MRQIAFAFIVLLLFSASEAQDTKKPALPAITMPMIDREVKTVTTEKVTVNRTCPAGYEGHYQMRRKAPAFRHGDIRRGFIYCIM